MYLLTCLGVKGAGYMYEADSLGTVIWQYNAGGTQKAFRYECKHPPEL